MQSHKADVAGHCQRINNGMNFVKHRIKPKQPLPLQDGAAAAERTAGIWGPDHAAGSSVDPTDWSGSPEEVHHALAARRAAVAERETALQQWAVALECEAARQASERRSLQLRAEQVLTTPMTHLLDFSKKSVQHAVWSAYPIDLNPRHP